MTRLFRLYMPRLKGNGHVAAICSLYGHRPFDEMPYEIRAANATYDMRWPRYGRPADATCQAIIARRRRFGGMGMMADADGTHDSPPRAPAPAHGSVAFSPLRSADSQPWLIAVQQDIIFTGLLTPPSDDGQPARLRAYRFRWGSRCAISIACHLLSFHVDAFSARASPRAAIIFSAAPPAAMAKCTPRAPFFLRFLRRSPMMGKNKRSSPARRAASTLQSPMILR